jgi:hypothetical protein
MTRQARTPAGAQAPATTGGRTPVDDYMATPGLGGEPDAIVEAAADGIGDARALLSVKRPAPAPVPGRVLVTMHYPLPMHVVSGIMRLVERAYPGSVVGEDGTIRELRQVVGDG